MFGSDVDFVDRIFIMDAHVASSHDMKAVKHQLCEMKAQISKVSLHWNISEHCHEAVVNLNTILYSQIQLYAYLKCQREISDNLGYS